MAYFAKSSNVLSFYVSKWTFIYDIHRDITLVVGNQKGTFCPIRLISRDNWAKHFSCGRFPTKKPKISWRHYGLHYFKRLNNESNRPEQKKHPAPPIKWKMCSRKATGRKNVAALGLVLLGHASVCQRRSEGNYNRLTYLQSGFPSQIFSPSMHQTSSGRGQLTDPPRHSK